uniref:Cytochrome P450, family 2, subfamily X, polypeptide 9 n=1 Tax=Salarias fasciatus TaxID=181472 RepID=A0A672FQE4_SALFA
MFVSVVLLLVCLYFLIIKTRRPRNFPPGPFALPILGNLLQLSLEDPVKYVEKLRRTYGNVYSLFIGSNPAVVISGLKVMKEAIVTKGVEFAGRPQDLFINAITMKKGVALANYGLSWKEHRRFALMTLRNFGMGRTSMEDRIHGEIQYLIKTLESNIGSPERMFHKAASNIICQVLFGTRYDYDNNFVTVIIQSVVEITKLINGPWSMLYDSFPFIRNLPGNANNQFEPYTSPVTMNTLLKFTEHKKTRVPGEPRDFIDCYLDEMDKVLDDSLFSEEQLNLIGQDLYIAGTDTTSNTLLSGFLYLTNNPHVQERCQREIDQVLEGKARVTFEDRHKMPYVQAVIHEIQRMSNTVPLSVFHCTTKNTELMGYSLPKVMDYCLETFQIESHHCLIFTLNYFFESIL